jgi:hypothetical protein
MYQRHENVLFVRLDGNGASSVTRSTKSLRVGVIGMILVQRLNLFKEQQGSVVLFQHRQDESAIIMVEKNVRDCNSSRLMVNVGEFLNTSTYLWIKHTNLLQQEAGGKIDLAHQ